MSVTYSTKKTWRFVEWLAIAALGSSIVIFLGILISPLFIRRIIEKQVTISPEEVYKFSPIEVDRSGLGALRVDADAQIPDGEWARFEIQILDETGKIIASGTKEGWSDSGTWYEDGESGTWSESDTLGGLDVRNNKKEKISIAIALLDRGTTAGAEINQPLGFNVRVENGVVDIGKLWFGLVGSLVLGVISAKLVGNSGKKVIAEKIEDSDPTGRGTMGGKNSLVRVKVKFDADEGSVNQSMCINLFVNNSYGEQIYVEQIPVQLNIHQNDGSFIKATGTAERFFVFPQKDSYGFHVEVHPDEPVDRTWLTVCDRVQTFGSVEVIEVV